MSRNITINTRFPVLDVEENSGGGNTITIQIPTSMEGTTIIHSEFTKAFKLTDEELIRAENAVLKSIAIN